MGKTKLGFKVILHTAKGQFEEFVQGAEINVGRDVSADLPVMASGVSRAHLIISQKNGKIKIKDLGSTNGTYIKGESVESHKELDYEEGTRISLGQAGCFIRIELLDQKIKVNPVKAVPTKTQIKESSQETNIFYFLGKKSDKDQGLNRDKQKALQHMENAEKLVRQRVSEAEDSIRKGVEKARENAKSILLAAKKESEILKAKSEIEYSNVARDIEELKAERSKFDLESRGAEKEFIVKEGKLKGLEAKLSSVDENHKNKVEALNTELLFLKSESDKKKAELSGLVESLEALAVNTELEDKRFKYLEKKSKDLESEGEKLEETTLDLNEKLLVLAKKNEVAEESLRNSSEKETGILSKAKEKAEASELEALAVKKEALARKKEILKAAKSKAADLLEKAKKQCADLIATAKLEKEDLLRETKECNEKAVEDYNIKMKEVKEFSRSERLKLKEELKLSKTSEWKKIDKEVASVKILGLRKAEEEMLEEKRLIHSYKKEYAESWGLAISIAVENSIKPNSESFFKITPGFREKIHVIAKDIIEGNRRDEEAEIQQVMSFDPAQREKVKKFWMHSSMAFAVLVAGFILAPRLFEGVKAKTQELAVEGNIASEERIVKFQEEVKALKAFTPEQRNEFFPTYTERVLYTPQYVENELSESYRESWFLSLDTFFVEDLVLSDEAIVTFISKETNLLKKLSEIKKGINAQFAEEGVQRMHDEEQTFAKEVKLILKTEAKLNKFRQFKLDYYMETFPFLERGLASDKD